MNLEKSVLLFSLSVAIALLTPSVTVRASTDPFGTSYLLNVDNFPKTGSGEIQFGGRRYETVRGTGIRVKEHVSRVHRKKLVEFWFRTWRDKPFVSFQEDTGAPSSISIEGIEWDDPGPIPWVKPGSAFLYFTHDGTPQPMFDKYGLGFEFGRHPKHQSIQVLKIDNPSWPLSDVSFGTDDLKSENLRDGLYALGLKPWKINDLHFGFKLHHPKIPEPSSFILAAAGAALSVMFTRRRRKRILTSSTRARS